MKNLLLLICLITFNTFLQAQKIEQFQEELSFEKVDANNVLVVGNMFGTIKVEGYEGDKVIMDYQRTISAKSDKLYQRALKEIKLKITNTGDSIIIHFVPPCYTQSAVDRIRNFSTGSINGFCWNNCNWNPRYKFSLDFTIKVPRNLNLFLSTINKGDIAVKGVKGDLEVYNINGGISLLDVDGQVYAKTINGDVSIDYKTNPTKDSEFKSHNGTINVNLQKGLNAKLYFKSYHGDLFTNIEDVNVLPLEMKKKETSSAEGLNFSLKSRTVVQVGNGNVGLEFQTWNGNVYVKE